MNALERNNLLDALRTRFEKNMRRHEGVAWADVQARLEGNDGALRSLLAMDAETGRITFCDCSRESPSGRRSLCYDRAALDARKENKPKGSAVEMAAEMGVELLTEEQYRALQALDELDLKTSTWIATPADVRSRGGALFCDRRYGRVFVYHNGAESYYAARGFRGILVV
jgi:hypothetical protein